MSDKPVSEATRLYWVDTVLGWAEERLMPPQYDECRRAIGLTAIEASYAAGVAAEQARWVALIEAEIARYVQQEGRLGVMALDKQEALVELLGKVRQ